MPPTVVRNWRLNERHYGALQGKNKKQTLDAYGEELFMLWRRSYDTPPPPIAPDDEYAQTGDPRYADLGADMPASECLKDVVARMLPYWEAAIVPDLRAGRTVLVAAHGNSLRAMVKHLDAISDEAISGLNIPTGMPLVYRLDESLRPLVADPGPLTQGRLGRGRLVQAGRAEPHQTGAPTLTRVRAARRPLMPRQLLASRPTSGRTVRSRGRPPGVPPRPRGRHTSRSSGR